MVLYVDTQLFYNSRRSADLPATRRVPLVRQTGVCTLFQIDSTGPCSRGRLTIYLMTARDLCVGKSLGKSSHLTRRHITVLQQRSKDPSTFFYRHSFNARSTDSPEILSSYPRLLGLRSSHNIQVPRFDELQHAPKTIFLHFSSYDTLPGVIGISDKLRMLQFSRQEVAERVEDHALREAFIRASCDVSSTAR
ncbi:hypothetical protein H4582DRAFT_1100161 [Lactarius indigo]|nr:hypothetical protein H4582DRAFT_1100161 [Lactarius indigo]